MLNFDIQFPGRISDLFIQKGVSDFISAAAYIRALRYQRTSNPLDICAVLFEERGTCSSKHAVLAELAREQRQNVLLRLGFYEMSGENTLGVGEVLKKYGIDSILEAHCYLDHAGERLDFTRIVAIESMNLPVMFEEEITSDKIGAYKNKRHREALSEWLQKKELPYSLDQAWKIREECISALHERA